MPLKSKAQQRWMFANKPEMAKRWAHETPDIKSLPEKAHKKVAGFVAGFSKIALDLPEEARQQSMFSMQETVPGGQARETMESGQSKGRATRTKGVLNEDRELDKKYKKHYSTSRGGGATSE